jgi:aquaporin Z
MIPTRETENAAGSRAKQLAGHAGEPAILLPTSSQMPAAFSATHPALKALARHWPEYLMEGAELGLFMISACVLGVVLQLPGSPFVQALPDPTLRRVLFGIAMALTAFAIIHSPWGKRSGAHFNPALTMTFARLKKIAGWDASFYVVAQFMGGIAGVALVSLFLAMQLGDPAVNYVATIPGEQGPAAAFVVEVIITFITMAVILETGNHPRWSRYTGHLVPVLIAFYISLVGPISGMSMNPARTTASAAGAHLWPTIWLYFLAPPLGMLMAAEFYLWRKGQSKVFCAKLHHHNDQRCIFRCRFSELQASSQPLPQSIQTS